MKVFIFRKRIIVSVLCYALILVTVLCFSYDAVKKVSALPNKLLPIYSVNTSKKEVAITFDAAWGDSDTQEIISVLKKYDAKATFFIVGQWAEKYPESVKAFYDADHAIGAHSYSHSLYSTLSESELLEDLAKTNEVLASVTGEQPDLVRTPSGDFNKSVMKTIYSVGLFPIQWDVDSLDYTNISKDKIVSNVLNKVKNGSIILFHNDVENTPEALDEILKKLTQRGYRFVRVDELIMKDSFSIDFQGRQNKKY